MMGIDVHFQRFSDIVLSDLIGAEGVFVAWEPNALVATFVGQGELLEGIGLTRQLFQKVNDGVVALIDTGDHEDDMCRAVEAKTVLLEAADQCGLWPRENDLDRHVDFVDSLHGLGCRFRLGITGRDPLVHPSRGVLDSRRQVEMWPAEELEWEMEMPWRPAGRR